MKHIYSAFTFQNASNQQISKLISDTTPRIIKPISEQISVQLLKTIGIYRYLSDKDSVNIYYHDDLENITKLSDDTGKAKVSHNRCDIVIEPIYNPKEVEKGIFNFQSDFTTSINVLQNTNRSSIFTDSKYGIQLFEFITPCQINLSITLSLKNIELADFVNLALYSKFYSERMSEYKNLSFRYNIPEFILVTLYELFKMRRDSLDNMSFLEYLNLGSFNNIDLVVDKTLINDSSSDQVSINVLRQNVFSIGYIEMENVKPDGEKLNRLVDKYKINFKYKIVFSRPSVLSLIYPLVINNKMIPNYLITSNTQSIEKSKLYDINPPIYKEDSSINTLLKTQNKDDWYPLYVPIIYPKEDSLLPIRIILGKEHIPIFQGILQCSYTYSKKTFIKINIDDEIFPLMQDYHDINAIRDVLKTQGIRSKSQYSLIPIVLYNATDCIIVDKRKIEISNDLVLRASELDDTKVYKLVLTINSHLYMMDKDLIFKALEYPKYFGKIIKKNLDILIMNKYVDVIDQGNIFDQSKDGITYIPGHVYPGTPVKGDDYGPYFIFRIGNLLIYSRKTRRRDS